MANIYVVFGRTTPLICVAMVFLVYGEILVVVNAFQATNFFPHNSCSLLSTRKTPSVKSPGDASKARIPLQHQCLGRLDPARGRLFDGVAVTPMNGTSLDALSGYAIRKHQDQAVDAKQINDEEGCASMMPTTTSTSRGRTRRAIQKMREKYLSRRVESRFARLLLVPMRFLIWKPLWMTIDIFTDRLNDDDTLALDTDTRNSIHDSECRAESFVDKYPDGVMKIATLDAPSVEIKQKEVMTSETTTKTASHNAMQTEFVNQAPPQSVAIYETKKETNDENVDLDVAVAIPKGDRWAIAAPGIDLSGKWELIVTDDFRKAYDRYLERLGQSRIVRSVALSRPVIGQTMEELIQTDQGHSLRIRGKNVRGTWDRTLIASGSTKDSPDFDPLISTIPTVDQEMVDAEAWWEDQGTVHVSWMRGVTLYGGGSFYSRRYLEEKEHEDDETVYACEGFFQFNDPKKENNDLTWRFRRQTT